MPWSCPSPSERKLLWGQGASSDAGEWQRGLWHHGPGPDPMSPMSSETSLRCAAEGPAHGGT